MGKLNLDLTNVEFEDKGGFEPLPAGKYDVEVVETSVNESKAGGFYTTLVYRVTSGEHENRKLWENYNVICSSDIAQRIARENIKRLAVYNGRNPVVNDSDDLLGCRARLSVNYKPNPNDESKPYRNVYINKPQDLAPLNTPSSSNQTSSEVPF